MVQRLFTSPFIFTTFKPPCATGPALSGGVRAITAAFLVMLMLLGALLEPFTYFLELCDFCRKLCIGTCSLFIRDSTVTLAPSKTLLASPVLLILATVRCIMGRVHALMLLAQDTVLCILATLLGDGVVERNNFSLGRVAGVCFSLLGLFEIGWEHLLNFLKGV